MREREQNLVYDEVSLPIRRWISVPTGTCTAAPGDVVLQTSIDTPCVTEQHYVHMTDVVTPNWKKRQSKGEIINNPMTRVSTIIHREPFLSTLTYDLEKYGCTPKKWYRQFTQSYIVDKAIPMPDSLGATVDLDSVKAQAVSACWAGISAVKLEGLVTALEFDKTIIGFLDLFKKAYRIIHALRKKEWKLLKSEFSKSEIIELYMNARYNLRPVFHDVKGLLAALDYDFTSKFDRQTFRAYKKEYDIKSEEDLLLHTPYSNAQTRLEIRGTYIENVSVEARAGVLTSFEPGDITMFEVLGLDQGLTSAWELIPFSFIVDWFVNVGDTICQFKHDRTFRALTSWVVSSEKTTKIIVPQAFVPWSAPDTASQRVRNFDYQANGGYTKIITETKVRTPNPARSILPRMTVNLDPLKIFDLAIITNKIRQKARIFRYR